MPPNSRKQGDFTRILFPTAICLLKAKNGNTRTMCENCLKLTIKTLERHQRRHSCLYCKLWTYFKYYFSVSIVGFKPVNTSWVKKSNLSRTILINNIIKSETYFGKTLHHRRRLKIINIQKFNPIIKANQK